MKKRRRLKPEKAMIVVTCTHRGQNPNGHHEHFGNLQVL
jgi:hypothetical protein